MSETTAVEKAPLRAGSGVMAIIPQDIDQVWRLAQMAVMGRMAPKSLTDGKDKNDATAACAIAIMAGAELGLSPMTALRSYAVVNGRPTLWGDGLKAVVRQSGKCEFIRAGGDLKKGWCEAKRSDTGEEMRREFTWEQAVKAKLDKKPGTWQDYPDMMLERRATFRTLNDLFADVLGGLSDAMDPVDELPSQGSRPQPPDLPETPELPSPEAEGGKVIEGEANKPAEDAVGTTDTMDRAEFLQHVDDELAVADDPETLDEIFDSLEVQEKLADDDTGLQHAFDLKRKHAERISKKAKAEDDGPLDMFEAPE